MRRTWESLTPDAPLAPVPSEILDQFVGRCPISHDETRERARATAQDHQDPRPLSDRRSRNTAKWARGGIHWRSAMNQFAILYEGRFTTPTA